MTNDIVVNTLRAVRKTVVDSNKRAMYVSIIDAYCESIGISTDEWLYEIQFLSPQISHEKNGARFSSGMALKIERRNLSSCGFVSYVGEIRVDHEGNQIQTSIGLTKRNEGNSSGFLPYEPFVSSESLNWPRIKNHYMRAKQHLRLKTSRCSWCS